MVAEGDEDAALGGVLAEEFGAKMLRTLGEVRELLPQRKGTNNLLMRLSYHFSEMVDYFIVWSRSPDKLDSRPK